MNDIDFSLFAVDDVFKVLPMSQHPYSPPNYGIAAFMLLSTRSDALEANSTLGIEAPVIIAFEAEVFSWVHNSSLSKIIILLKYVCMADLGAFHSGSTNAEPIFPRERHIYDIRLANSLLVTCAECHRGGTG